MSEALKATMPAEEPSTKLLGAHVDEDIYWEFKNKAAKRKEPMVDAIRHAALMYIHAEGGEKKND